MKIAAPAFALLLLAWSSPALAQSDPAPVTSTSISVQWGFTQACQCLDETMADGINAGSSRIDAALYAINRPSIVQAFIDAQSRCGCVRLISDATQSGGASQKAAMRRMQAAGIPIKVDAHSGIMHMKVVSVDSAVIYEGSFNATTPASTINDEVEFRIESTEAATAFGEEFDLMWSSPRFKDWNPSGPVPPAGAF